MRAMTDKPTLILPMKDQTGADAGFVLVEPDKDGSLYLEVADGDEELRFRLTPEQVAQLQDFLS